MFMIYNDFVLKQINKAPNEHSPLTDRLITSINTHVTIYGCMGIFGYTLTDRPEIS
jgi:hypothetical protein